jgi:flagellar hook assembly protein FlgD
VTSPDETKVLKWDPVRGIADTSFSYSLECAQRKWCQVKVSIYSTDGMKVYEEWLEKLAPGSYSFTWDGSVNVVPPPPLPMEMMDIPATLSLLPLLSERSTS